MYFFNKFCLEVFLWGTDLCVILFVVYIHKNQVEGLWLLILNVFVSVTNFWFELSVGVKAEMVDCHFDHLGIDVYWYQLLKVLSEVMSDKHW